MQSLLTISFRLKKNSFYLMYPFPNLKEIKMFIYKILMKRNCTNCRYTAARQTIIIFSIYLSLVWGILQVLSLMPRAKLMIITVTSR